MANLYAGGCVDYELGPVEAATDLIATPSLLADFLLSELDVYL